MILHIIQGWVPAIILTSVSPADRSMVKWSTDRLYLKVTQCKDGWRSNGLP